MSCLRQLSTGIIVMIVTVDARGMGKLLSEIVGISRSHNLNDCEIEKRR